MQISFGGLGCAFHIVRRVVPCYSRDEIIFYPPSHQAIDIDRAVFQKKTPDQDCP